MQYPKNWPTDKIGDLFDVLIGGTPSRKEPSYWDSSKTSDNVWLSIRDVSNFRSLDASESLEYISDLGVKNSNVKRVPKNTALMTFKLTLGKTAVTTRELYTNEAIAAFVPKSGVIADPYYLATILPLLDYDVDQAVKGSTLNKVKIQDARIPLPDIKVQKRIAAILGSIDATTTSVQKVIDQTEKLKKSLQHDFFTESNNWNKKPIGHLTELIIDHRGKTPTKLGGSWSQSGIAAISAMNVKANKIIKPATFKYVDQALYKKWMKQELKAQDILLTSEAPMGEMYIVQKKDRFCLSQRLFALRLKGPILPDFFYCYLSSVEGRKQLELRKSGSTAQGIRQSELLKIEIPLPDLKIQKKIATVLGEIDSGIYLNKKSKAKQEQLKQSLVRDLLTGKVRI